MILGLDYGDPERLAIIGLILLSLYQLYRGRTYDFRLKVILTIPRTYLLIYYSLVAFNIYKGTFAEAAVRSGIFSLYGILLLFGVEVYVRWVSRKYGKF